MRVYNLRIYHECDNGIEKSVPSITDWHHEACRVMINNIDPEGRIFLSQPHTNIRLFFLLTLEYHIFVFQKRFPEVPEYAEMQH